MRIAVIGAGLMGHGIALEFAAAGHTVRIHDCSRELVLRGIEQARRSAQLLVQAGRITAGEVPAVIARIEPADTLAAASTDAAAVIEAVYEDLVLKQQVFAALDRAAPPHALLLSNSSAFMPSELAAATSRPERVAVAHYFDPPFLLPLVELVRGPQTSVRTMDAARSLYEGIGKRPVVIEKEMPGSVGNRLQGALGREANALVSAGVATPEDIDTVVKYGFGRRLAVAGPFEVWELIGWDLVSTIGAELWKDISRDTGQPAGAKAGAARPGDQRPPAESADALRGRMERTLVEQARWDPAPSRQAQASSSPRAQSRGPVSAHPSPPDQVRDRLQPSPARGKGAAGAPSPTGSGPAQKDPSPWEGEGLGVGRRTRPEKHPGINRVAIIGAGLMGHGIALEFAAAGYEVTLTDRSKDILDSVIQRARKGLELLAEARRIGAGDIEGALLRVQPQSSLANAVKAADLVIEAVTEDIGLKRRIFAELDAAAPANAVLLSNTSTYLPSALASATKRPDRVAVAHYFNPPHLLPVVEIVRGPQTSEHTVTLVRDIYERMGKRPAVVQKEVLGFIGNRLQFAMFREALSLVQKGVVSAPELDAIVRDSFGRRLPAAGIFARRTLLSPHLAARSYSPITPTLDNFTEVPPVLREKVAKGHLGTKTGKGFYDWTPESAEALRLRIGRALVEMAKWDV